MKLDLIYKSLKLIGRENYPTLIYSLLTAFIWVLSDFLLVYVFQYFLTSIGAIHLKNTVTILNIKLIPDLNTSIFIIIAFGFLKMLLQVAKIYFTQSLFEKLSAHLKVLIINSIINSPFKYSSHDVILMFTERSGLTAQYLIQLVNSFFYLTITVTLFIICFKMCPFESLIVFPLVLILIFPLRFFNNKINFYGDEIVRFQRNIFKGVITSLKNLKLITIYNKTENEFSKGVQDIINYKNNAIDYYIIFSLKSSLPYFIGIISIASTSYISINFLKTNTELLAPFFYLFIRACQNLGDFTGSFGELKKLSPNFISYYDWAFENSEEHTTSNNISNSKIINCRQLNSQESITIKATKLGFSYKNNNLIFNDINFEVSTGKCLLIKGKSGTGKSTLLKLIMGFEKPTNGEIIINGVSSFEIKNEFSNVVGYVGPENYFFEGTIIENLNYLNNSPSKEEIIQCLEKANLTNEIKHLPDQLNTILNENSQLSTGQMQRLSIARALTRSPMILILDEATANLDTESEERIIESLKTLKSKMLIIAISHKSSFDCIADITLQLK